MGTFLSICHKLFWPSGNANWSTQIVNCKFASVKQPWHKADLVGIHDTGGPMSCIPLYYGNYLC